MSDGKADGPYRFKKIEQCERNEDVEEALFGPGADRCDYENADVDYLLNFGFREGASSRDAEVDALKEQVFDYTQAVGNASEEIDALKERVKELELQLAQSVPCEWEGAAIAAREDRDALRKENERLTRVIKNSFAYCENTFCGGYQDVREYEIFVHGMRTVGNHLESALAQPQRPQEVKP